MAIQILPENVRYRLVIHACTRNNKERHPSGASLIYLMMSSKQETKASNKRKTFIQRLALYHSSQRVGQLLIYLLQLADCFGDIDEVVGDTLGVLGKGDILGSGLRFADAQRETLDMVALHFIGQTVNLVLYLVGTPEGFHVHLMVRLHGCLIELGDEGVHLVDLLDGVFGEAHVVLLQTLGVLDDVRRVVAYTLQIADRADGGNEVLVVKTVELFVRQPHGVLDEFAVEEVEFFFGLVEDIQLAGVKRLDNLYRPAEISYCHFRHVFNLGFELAYRYYRRAEHLLVEEIEMRLIFGRLRLVFDDLTRQCYQCAGERQGYEHRADIEDGVEHRQLELRRCRKKVLEERAKRPYSGGEQAHCSGNQQEEHDTHYVENEVDHRRPFGSCSAGQTCDDRYHA